MPMALDSHRRQGGQRVVRSPGVGVLASMEGVALMVGHLVATPIIGRERLRWGTRGTEATDPLPGDELVPVPKWSHTLGVAVHAPPEAVWPWIAQIGQGRGGFYSYQTLENLAGCQITNTTSILPEYQHPAVGDAVYLFPDGPPLRVEIVDPPHALVLFGSPADVGPEDFWGRSTWQFAVTSRPRRWEPAAAALPIRPRPGLEEPPDVRTLPARGDQLRDEPQDAARDQAAR